MSKNRKVKKIQDRDNLYSFLKYYVVDFSLKFSYRTIKYVGREKIPTDGAVIYAPNHTNALMDALIILSLDKKPKVFVARADIFKKRLFAKILTFLKIMPIMRIRDGYDEVKKNNETIEKAVDVLKDKVPFCILPEGTHRAMHSLLPLSKGIFRIAMQAQPLLGDTPLYIVPVGLEYGNFFRFRSTVRVQIGDPINISQFLNENSQYNAAEQMNILKDDLTAKMKDTIVYIPDDENYDATYDICAAVVNQQNKELAAKQGKRFLRGLDGHFVSNRATVEKIGRLKTENPKLAEKLFSLGNKARHIRVKKGISLSSVSIQYPFWSRLLKFLIFVLLLPYTIPASILSSPTNALSRFLFTKMKDHAFRNSVVFVINLVVWPLLLLIYSIVGFCLFPWEWVLLGILVLSPAPIFAQETYRLFRLMISDVKLLFNSKLRKIYAQIREILAN